MGDSSKVNQKTILPHRRFHWSTRSLSQQASWIESRAIIKIGY